MLSLSKLLLLVLVIGVVWFVYRVLDGRRFKGSHRDSVEMDKCSTCGRWVAAGVDCPDCSGNER